MDPMDMENKNPEDNRGEQKPPNNDKEQKPPEHDKEEQTHNEENIHGNVTKLNKNIYDPETNGSFPFVGNFVLPHKLFSCPCQRKNEPTNTN